MHTVDLRIVGTSDMVVVRAIPARVTVLGLGEVVSTVSLMFTHDAQYCGPDCQRFCKSGLIISICCSQAPTDIREAHLRKQHGRLEAPLRPKKVTRGQRLTFQSRKG